ncbi:MAG: hypothetical protein JRJ26_12050 [Deltaproteobacteria bacterium]|nr:hypothetical protein [Deltaproteobacteria bacterium]
MIRIYAVFWLVLLAVAVANGIVREKTYGHSMSDLCAHQVSTVLAMILTGVAAGVFAQYFPIRSGTVALVIGGIWAVLTAGFEFTFGRYVAGHSWEKLLLDYNILAGRMWSVFLLWILILPYIVFRLGGRAT